MSMTNLHESAPTRFQEVGDVCLACRRFGKEGAPPLVCLQHFTGTMNNFDPIHTNWLAQDRPVVLVDYRGVGRSSGEMPGLMQSIARDIIAFIRTLGAEQVDLFAFSLGGRGAPSGRLHRHRKSAAIVSYHSAGCHGVAQHVFGGREERQHQ